MKKSIALIAVVSALYICWKSLEPVSESGLHPAPAQANLTKPAEQPAVPAPAAPPEPANLNKLEEELAQLGHELRRAGYPEVLMDERLSDGEREELITKVLKSEDLYERVVNMRIASISRNRK